MPLQLVPPIHRATHRIGLYLADLRDHDLSQGEAHILALLATAAPATIADLHRGLAHKRSTLTSILDRLAARGFITRAVGTDDRRTFITDRERAACRESRPSPLDRPGEGRRAPRDRGRRERIHEGRVGS
jgi:DNA-binding MarR family transcriptional regulator